MGHKLYLAVAASACVFAVAVPACDMGIQCESAIECVETCDGPVIQSGCDPCPDGSFDRLLECEQGAGGADTGGAAAGAGGAGGDGGAGGSEPEVCEIPECAAAINCVEACGGPVVTVSCCPCEDGLVDVETCNGGGGGAGGAG